MKFLPCFSATLVLSSLVAPLSAQTSYVLSTLAGSAGTVVKSAEGTGTAAQFDTPRGIAVDSSGTVYVADSSNYTIRKITAAGVVTTLAGTAGFSGSTNGTGAAARFNEPFGVAVDSAGTIYVADTSSNAIRKITPAGVVTTLAGGGLSGSSDGTGTAASFHEPRGLTLDSAGNVFVADYENNTVRKITAAGVVTTLAGTVNTVGSTDATGTAAKFNAVHGIAVDSSGNVFVADGGNRNIRKITPAGVVTTFAGGTNGESGLTDGTGTAARFSEPHGLTIDTAGTLYVTDSSACTLRKITSAGVVTTLAGTAGTPGSTDGTGTAAKFTVPYGVTVDSSGNLYVCDHGNHTIRKVTSAGVVTTLAGTAGSMSNTDATGSSARFKFPSDVAVDSSGNVFVADTDNQVLRKITSAGVTTTIAGSGAVGSTDGLGTAAKFYNPKGIAVDSSGNLYVTDRSNHTLRKGSVATAASITTQPTAQAVTSGGTLTLTVVATGTPAPTSYQWYKNGTAISGATSATYTVTAASSTDAGSYTCVVDNGVASATTTAVVVTVSAAARLSNLSVRTNLAAGSSLIFGLVMDGGARDVLIRAGGAALRNYGVTTAMTDPKLEFFNGANVKTTENDDWSSSLTATIASTGAFAYTAGSKDAALVQTLNGGCSVKVTGTATGVVLVEAFDIGTGNSPRLVNVSARNKVGTGEDALFAGFYISGTGTKQILVRAIGPTLATYGVTGTLADPKLEIYNSANVLVASNDNWSSSLTATFTSVAAFALTPNSKDAALVAVLPADALYSAKVTGADGGTGEALIEIYELP